jgi:hypothetical protein
MAQQRKTEKKRRSAEDFEAEKRAQAAVNAPPSEPEPDPPVTVEKPAGSKLDRFKSTRTAAPAGVKTLLGPMPVLKLSEAKDFVMVHPDPAYWSSELCFVSVPVQGVKNNVNHLGFEDVLMSVVSDDEVERHALALASKPCGVFFLAIIPTQNLENTWNETALEGATKAKAGWVKVVSRRKEGVDQ